MPVDKPKTAGHLFETTSQLTSTVAPKARADHAARAETDRATRAQQEKKLAAPRPVSNLPSRRADAPSATVAGKRCMGCEADAMRSTVFGLTLCRWCGERVNDVVGTGVCVGVEFVVVSCALVQWLREMPVRLRGAA
jgi:hypothetical protein